MLCRVLLPRVSFSLVTKLSSLEHNHQNPCGEKIKQERAFPFRVSGEGGIASWWHLKTIHGEKRKPTSRDAVNGWEAKREQGFSFPDDKRLRVICLFSALKISWKIDLFPIMLMWWFEWAPEPTQLLFGEGSCHGRKWIRKWVEKGSGGHSQQQSRLGLSFL